ncbi:MAG: hypothetical protein JZD40_03935 [Sulfolobus sp.]|nr:hypothetical protein [Sulfolobus sp.]
MKSAILLLMMILINSTMSFAGITSYIFINVNNFPIPHSEIANPYFLFKFENGIVVDGLELVYNGSGLGFYEGAKEVFFYPILPENVIGLYNYVVVIGKNGSLALNILNMSYVYTPFTVINAIASFIMQAFYNLVYVNGSNSSLLFYNGTFIPFNSSEISFIYLNSTYFGLQTKAEIFIYAEGRTYTMRSYGNILTIWRNEIFVIGQNTTTVFTSNGAVSVPYRLDDTAPVDLSLIPGTDPIINLSIYNLYYGNGWFTGSQVFFKGGNISSPQFYFIVVGHGIKLNISFGKSIPYMEIESNKSAVYISYFSDNKAIVLGINASGIMFNYSFPLSLSSLGIGPIFASAELFVTQEGAYFIAPNGTFYYLSPKEPLPIFQIPREKSSSVIKAGGNLYIADYETHNLFLVKGNKLIPLNVYVNNVATYGNELYVTANVGLTGYIYVINGDNVTTYTFPFTGFTKLEIDRNYILALVYSSSPPVIKSGVINGSLQKVVIIKGDKVIGEGFMMPSPFPLITSNNGILILPVMGSRIMWINGYDVIISDNSVPLNITASNAMIIGNGFTISNIVGNETLYLPKGYYLIKQGAYEEYINLSEPMSFIVPGSQLGISPTSKLLYIGNLVLLALGLAFSVLAILLYLKKKSHF